MSLKPILALTCVLLAACVPAAVALAAAPAAGSAHPVALRQPIAGHLSTSRQLAAVGRAQAQHAHLADRYVAALRRLDALRGHDAPGKAAVRAARRHGNPRLRRDLRRLEREIQRASARAQPAHAASASASMTPALAAIAQCESGGNPAAVGGGGTYRGLFQFDRSTWASVGGSGDPAAASEAEQVKRAQILYARSGPGQWPVCGR